MISKKEMTTWIINLFSAITVLAIVLIVTGVSIDGGNLFNWGWLIVALEGIYAVLSLQIVHAGKKAAVIFLGKPLYSVESGFQFIPFFICKLKLMPSINIQLQIPGEPEDVDKSGNDVSPLAGKMKPVRVTTADEKIAEFQGLTGDEKKSYKDFLGRPMTLEILAYITIKIKDAADFVNTFDTTENMLKLLRDLFESEIKTVYGKETVGYIIRNLDKINEKITEKMRGIIEGDKWKLEFIECKVTDNDLTHTINKSLRDAQDAEIKLSKANDESETIKIMNDASKDKITKEGEGTATALKAKVLAEAAGKEASLLAEAKGLEAHLTAEAKGIELKAVAATKKGARLVIITEAWAEALHGANYSVIAPDSIAHMSATFKAVSEHAKVKKAEA